MNVFTLKLNQMYGTRSTAAHTPSGKRHRSATSWRHLTVCALSCLKVSLLSNRNVVAVSVNPGFVASDIWRHVWEVRIRSYYTIDKLLTTWLIAR
jgi:hypothetical protein